MQRLEEIGEGIFVAEGDVVSFYGFAYPTRMVVVLLASDDLWVWSPVALDDELIREVNALGRPRHLVSPNKLHHLYLAEWKQAFPEALLWAPASTIRKRAELTFEPALRDVPPFAWVGEIDQAWFRGSLFMDEIVFFHRASRTAIIADLSENFSEHFIAKHWPRGLRWVARTWKIVEGYGYAPLEWRLSFTNRTLLHAARDKVLAWQPERVVMAHGTWQRSGGVAYLERAFAWM